MQSIIDAFLNSKGLQSFDELLQAIADALHISVDLLMTNGMDYLRIYAKYVLFKDLVHIFSVGVVITFIATFFAIIVALDENGKTPYMKIIKVGGSVFLSFAIATCAIAFISSIPYIASPEIFGLEYLLEYLNVKK